MLRRRRTKAGPSRRQRRSRAIRAFTAAAVAVVVLVAIVVVARLYVDWLWFGEVALRQVFWTRLWYGLALGALFGVSFFAIVYANVAVARRLAPKVQAFEGIDVVEYVHEGASRRVRQIALVVTALVALRVGLGAAGSWLTFARALNGVPFGIEDPIFHHDFGFYVFTLPAWQYVYTFLFATLVVALIAALVTHLAVGGVWLERREAGTAAGGGGPRSPAAYAYVRASAASASARAASRTSRRCSRRSSSWAGSAIC